MRDDRDFELAHDVTRFVAELRRLADALESGAGYGITLGGEEVTIPADALFAIAHEREGSEVELEFQLTWSLAPAGDDDEEEDDEEEEEDDEDEDDEEEDDEEDPADEATPAEPTDGADDGADVGADDGDPVPHGTRQ